MQRFLESADYVADQLGHEDSRFTDRVYRQTPTNRRDRLAPAQRESVRPGNGVPPGRRSERPGADASLWDDA